MYIGRERLAVKSLNKKGRPIELSTNGTSIVPGYVPHEDASQSAAVIKRLKSMDHFRTILDYDEAIQNLKKEKFLFEEHSAVCLHLIKLLGTTYKDNGEIAELHLQRVLPLKENLNFIKAQGLPNLLSVARGFHNYLSYIHSQGLVDNDFKIDNFGLDYESEETTYADETLHINTLKRYDLSLIEPADKDPGDSINGTAMYMAKYRFNEKITPSTLIKTDLFAFTLSLYDLITGLNREEGSKVPKGMSFEAWVPQLLDKNHLVRFKPSDLLFATNGNIAEAIELTVKLNQVLAKALALEEKESYSNATELYLDFVYCFQPYLTEEQFARLSS